MNAEQMDELCFLWKEYAREVDSRLTLDAIELKQSLFAFVAKLPVFKEPEYNSCNKTVKENGEC